MSSPPSHIANRYRFVETLGRGGMGEVWKAYDERLNRYCAVKVLRQTQDAATVERFSREARTLANIRHPGVVIVYDYGVDNDRPYLVMELLPGPSLAELLREQGPLPIETVRRYGSQAASALQAVHDAGVVHRDIKPANLVIDNTGSVRLVDFGIALGSVTTDHTLTEHGAIIGSAAYLAPEQAVGGRADMRSDLYGFGCLLVTLLTGRPPFDDDSPVEILTRHLNDSPVRPSDRRPEVPADIDALVMQLLAKQPEQRPASAAEVAARLGGATGSRPLPGPVPMPARGAQPQVSYRSARGEDTSMMAPAPPPRSGFRPALVILGVLALLAAGGVGWALSQGDEDAGTRIPFVSPTPRPSLTPVPSVTPIPTPSPSPSIGPPPDPNPLATPTPRPTQAPTPTPVVIGPRFPSAELDALESAVNSANYTDAAAKQNLLTRVAQIRQAVQAYVDSSLLSRSEKRAAALDQIQAFKGAVEDLKTPNPNTDPPMATIDDTTASSLQQKADAVAAKL